MPPERPPDRSADTREQTGNQRTIDVLRKPDKLISYRHANCLMRQRNPSDYCARPGVDQHHPVPAAALQLYRANRSCTIAIPTIRVPDGSCSVASITARDVAASGTAGPFDRRATPTISATVPSTISTPMTMTAIVNARILDPMLPPNRGYAYPAPVMKQNAPMSGPIHIAAPPEAAGQRIDRFVADAIGTISRSRVKSSDRASAPDDRGPPDHRTSRGGACRRRLHARHPARGARNAATAAHPVRHTV